MDAETQTRVLLVGAGLMGRAMALNLKERGFAVTVADVDSAAMAFFKQNRLSVTEFTHLFATKIAVIISVVNAEQIHDILFGQTNDGSQSHHRLADRLHPGSTVLITSTIGPDDLQRFASALQSGGIHTLDAPISGGPNKARNGSMSLMLAGDEAVIESHRSLLHAMSTHIQPLGAGLGDASAAKLINNALATVHLYNHCCALLAAENAGLEPEAVNRLVAASSGQSWIGQERMSRRLAKAQPDLEPQARMALLAKDSALALAMLKTCHQPTSWLQAAADCFAHACAAGFADADDSELITFLRQRAANLTCT